MVRPKKDGHGKQDGGRSVSNNKITAKAPQKKVAAASSTGKNPTPTTTNHSQLQRITRSIARVPPNNVSFPATNLARTNNVSLPATNLARTPNAASVTTVAFASSITPVSFTSSVTPIPFTSSVTPMASTSSVAPRNLSSVINMAGYQFQNPEVRFFRLPIATNLRTGEHLVNQGNDDVTYLYTVDTSPAGRIIDEVDLTEETEVENPGPSKKKTVTKVQKNRKRKVEEDSTLGKRIKNFKDALPMCSICDIHNDSLVENEEHMFVASCGHLFCAPCTRNTGVSDCEACGKRINALRKVYF